MNSELEQLVNHAVAKAVEAAVAETCALLRKGWNGPPEYLTEQQAAHFTGFSPRSLEQMRMRGEGPKYYRAGARAIRYKVSDLRAWVESGVIAAPKDGAQ